VNFLLDAQLPRRLSYQLRSAGHDALHTLDLPAGNRTTDEEINAIAERESRVVMTKDADFVNSFLLARRPPKLLLISTGNIGNQDLENLVTKHLAQIAEALLTNDFVELTRSALIIHA
jgi:predicted nuclease of predicted toxin-antitoxin system